MGRKNKQKHFERRIPTLDNANDCRDWIDRHKRRPSYVHQWDVWFAWLGRHPYSSVQEGDRPVIIISNDLNNQHSNTVTVVPLTTKVKHLEQPTHIVIDDSSGWKSDKPSMALVEQMTTIDKRRLMGWVGAVTDEGTKEKLSGAVKVQLGMEELS